ncbi:MAG: FtsX-like permease family protein [Candidatus Saccharicenans sp.]|nr:FtsX-like permease family protein [Candidatus Saccharicenans sp.]
MKVLLKLAIRNLLAAGLRTWLNVIVLSLTFVVIIAAQGLFRGMGDQAARASIDYEFGGGQFWHPAYDPYDPLTIQDAHGPIPEDLKPLLASGQATPLLIIQGTLYPQGRFLPVLVKGIDPDQNILAMPSPFLAASATESKTQQEKIKHSNNDSSDQAETFQDSNHGHGEQTKENIKMNIPDEIPAIIGTRMAAAARLAVGDTAILRWRDWRGAYDARPVRIVHIFRTIVQSVDSGQVWIPLSVLQAMAGLPGEATIITLAPGVTAPAPTPRQQAPLRKNLSGKISVLIKTDGNHSSTAAGAAGIRIHNKHPEFYSRFAAAIKSQEFKRPSEKLEAAARPADLVGTVRTGRFLISAGSSAPVPSSGRGQPAAGDWAYRDLRYLLRDIDQLVAAKTAGSTTVYVILLFMSLLAIFDTQVLNIFHRIREIGTLVALGLTRRQIVVLFTLEGTLQAVLAAVLAALYGYPLLSAFARTGWKMPEAFDSFGIALGERLVPVFTGGIIVGTVILILSLTAIISFWPARRLSRLRPTDALRGKLQ